MIVLALQFLLPLAWMILSSFKIDEVIYVPKTSEYLTPILTSIPTQLLAYHIAVMRGCNVDKPRNLAKVVTVD